MLKFNREGDTDCAPNRRRSRASQVFAYSKQQYCTADVCGYVISSPMRFLLYAAAGSAHTTTTTTTTRPTTVSARRALLYMTKSCPMVVRGRPHNHHDG